MEQLTVKSLYNLKETIARDIFEGVTYFRTRRDVIGRGV